MRFFVVVSVLAGLLVGGERSMPPVVEQVVDVPHTPPVDAPIIDPFRPPSHDYGPGNRGLEYDTFVGQAVRASGPGVVVFAGQVGGNLFVTVRHSLSLVTTVGYLSDVEAGLGQTISQGDRLGTAGETLHFSARLDGEYIDPDLLFQRYRVVVRLVPDPE